MISRIRTVKPELFRNAKLYDAELESGLPIRWCWAGLLTVLDREGRFEWKPRELKTLVAPYDDFEFAGVLNALVKIGKVVPYVGTDGRLYGVVPTFPKHQVINHREAVSLIPPPTSEGIDAAQTQLALGFEVPPNSDLSPGPAQADLGVPGQAQADTGKPGHARGEGKGREGKGINHRAASGDGFVLPEWIPAETWGEFERMRDKKKKPMTDRARVLIVKELERLRQAGNGAAAVLDQSIVNSWQDVFPLRANSARGNGSAPKRDRMSASERAEKMSK